MYIEVHVTPNAKKESVNQPKEGLFVISVKEPAKHNLANKRVREIMAREFHVSLGAVRLISGHRSPKKIFAISNNQ